ncbi:MAG: hypothetical protein KJ592_00530, partial [Nanoarchaeota archaeon]|nr:hypothetical protein [Nanoarchaeota archaeon]
MKKGLSYFMMVLLMFGSFAPFVDAVPNSFSNTASAQGGFYSSNYGSATNTWQSSRPTFDNFYSGSFETYWPILTNLEKDQCDAVSSDFIIGIPPGGCSPTVVRSDLLAEQNVPVFCQLSAIRVNPLIDVSTIKGISFKGDYPDEVAGISFHPARAATRSFRTLIGDPIEENIGYVVIVLKRQPDERNLEEYVSGMLSATVRYDAQGAFGTGAAEYYLEPKSDDEWDRNSADSSFWAGKGYLRVTDINENRATIQVMTNKDDVYRTVTLKEGETSSRIYYPGYYCTAALSLRLNKIDNSEDMAKIDIDGDSYWVRKGSSLLGGKCRVKDLNVFPGGSGEVEISCAGESTFKLVLGDKGVVFEKDGENVSVGIGGEIDGKYLGYYGRNSGLVDGDKKEIVFAVVFDKELTRDDVSEITGIIDSGVFKSGTEIEEVLGKVSRFKSGKVLVNGEDNFVSLAVDFSDGKSFSDPAIADYLKKARETTLELVKEYPSEKKENGEYWGEEALYKAIGLAGELEDEAGQVVMIDKFLEEYPGSANVEYMRDLRLRLTQFNYAGSSKNVFVNNNNYNIRAEGFVSGSGLGDSVTIRVDGKNNWAGLKRGVSYDIDNQNEIDKDKSVSNKLTVIDIDGTSAKFSYVWRNGENSGSKTFSVGVGSYVDVGGKEFYLDGTKVREVAYVSLIPEVRNTETVANFTFNIGVEKRAIELTPEKANLKIKALEKSIAEWEDRVDKLGSLVKGLKGACFAVSTVLTLKSAFTGIMGGTALARGEVMDYYEKICREGGASTSAELQRCYSEMSPDIDAAIKAYGGSMVAVNADVKKCTEGSAAVKSGFLEQKVVDMKGYVEDLKKNCPGLSDWTEYKGVRLEDLKDASDVQAVMLKQKACASGEGSVACILATTAMEEKLRDNVEMVKDAEIVVGMKNKVGIEVPSAMNPNRDSVWQNAISAKGSKIGSGSNYVAQVYNPSNSNERYYVELNKDGQILDVYNLEGEKVVDEGSKIANKIASRYRFRIPADGETVSCSNEMKKPYVKYYESGNVQGPVAVVPFDVNNGWYAYVDEDGYTDAVVPKSFWICNVGKDGIISDGVSGGDRCVRFEGSSNVPFTPCPSKQGEVARMYQKAEAAIREANRNKNGITVDGRFVAKTAPLGPSSGVECSDFMSVEDCNLMFNVCDPVICPSSRCDMGGTIHVADVISTGIIGSIALCLPNAGPPSKGGVLIPVCLSGIHAGLDSYVSILKSHKACLEKNVASGRYVGICDQITSIYTCEFFWGQLSPLMDGLLTRLTSSLYGGFQTKGGAEYLTVQKAFDNLDKSIDYFQDTYAKNAFRAFELGSTEEIGSTVCKAFVGTSLPTSADALDDLLEPESPTQFYAYFSEDVFSEATVPSTSHYKVYYHIYAGNDAGVQYRVYLTSPPESSYYSSRQTILVDSGYAGRGVAADEAIDFTAPTGYKELCVSINGADECGFGSVTSDFGLNYASQLYVADQASDIGITSTEDCVTTSVSGFGAVSGKGLGVSTLGQDSIGSTGISRVCA